MSVTNITACKASNILKVVIRPILSETAPQKKRPSPLKIELTAMRVAPAALRLAITEVSAKSLAGTFNFNISCSKGD